MALLTLIARVSDGLALSASIQDEEVKYEFYVSVYVRARGVSPRIQSGRNIADYQTQAKQIFRKLSPQSPTKCSIESNQLVFQ